MFDFSVSKDMTKKLYNNKKLYNKRGGSREGSGTLMSNIDYQQIEN
jgi:hypothetical protein